MFVPKVVRCSVFCSAAVREPCFVRCFVRSALMFCSVFCSAVSRPGGCLFDVLFGVLFGIEAMFCSVFCSATCVLFGSDVLLASFVLFGVLFDEKMFCSFS